MKRSASWVLGSLLVASSSWAVELNEVCPVGKTCKVPLPGAVCADGSPSFVNVHHRKGAENLLVYLSPGGACWDAASCKRGYAATLTNDSTEDSWETGAGVHAGDDPTNPFSKYSVVSVPYCTGDVHGGDREAMYDDNSTMRHYGYRNGTLAIEMAQQLFPKAKKAVLLGCSAGGIGTLFQQRNLERLFPDAQKYIVDDSGTPFSPPFVDEKKYAAIRETWGTETATGVDADGNPITNFRALVLDNLRRYPKTRFAFLSTYRDAVMSFFASQIGAGLPILSLIRGLIVDLANDPAFKQASNAQVYYKPGVWHCLTKLSLRRVSSQNVKLSDWLESMVSDDAKWTSVRDDARSHAADELLPQ